GTGGAGGAGGLPPVGLGTGAGGLGGAGGTGGAGAYFSATGSSLDVSIGGSVRGGTGGAGGGTFIGGISNNGAAGGVGVALTSGTITNAGTIAGGSGGDGGVGVIDIDPGRTMGAGANGGVGGAGISASSSLITNSGTITGGVGGAGGLGDAAPDGAVGAGGAGIVGSGLTVVTGGTINGGLSGDGAARANAISFTGGSNTLQLQSGYSFLGNVVGTGSDALQLGGSSNASFNVSNIGALYTGFTSFVKVGTSTWTLTGTTSSATPWILTQGVLSASSDASLGAASSGLTFGGGTLQFGASFNLAATRGMTLNTGGGTIDTQSFATTIGSAIIGTGGLTKLGSATLTLTGANTYTGRTTISAGTLQIGNGGTTGAIVGDVTNNGTLLFDRSDVTGFGGTIGGSGLLSQIGAGTLTLTGASTYTGATNVQSGTLIVDGSIAASSLTSVNGGATLSGQGTVGALKVLAGGVFAPGSGTAGSSMTVTGSLALQSGAFYMVQINPTISSSANVTGGATLGGSTVKVIYANGSYVAKQYTILTAAGVSGTFGSLVDTNLPSNFHSTLSYDATKAYLNLVLNFVPPPGSGLSGNQQNVGNAIINYFNSNGGIPLVYSALTANGLTQASGETATGSQQTTFQAMTQFMGLLTDPFGAGRGTGASALPAFVEESEAANSYVASRTRSAAARDAYAMFAKAPPRAFDARWNVWAAGFGGDQTTDGSATLGSNTSTSRLGGVAVGADYWLSPQTVVGFALAGGATNFSIANGLGSGRSDLFQAGTFVRHTVNNAYITVAAAYGWQDITTDRTVTIAGIDQLRAHFNANAYSGRIEGGNRYVVPRIGGVGLTPYAAGQFTTFQLPAYAESVVSGAGTFALAYAASSVTDTRSEIGLRSDKSYALADAILTLRGRAAWAHDFNPDRTIGATFHALPGASFVVNGARQASDSALTTASAEMKWLSGWSLAATFEGEFSNVTRSYAGKGVARYSW
ncbi:MAG: autotransporter domain-containing protein, partial [Bradyrhizobium sp.]